MNAFQLYPSKVQEEALIAFLEEMNISYTKEEKLPQHVLDGIDRGLEDVAHGRTITLEQFKKQRQ